VEALTWLHNRVGMWYSIIEEMELDHADSMMFDESQKFSTRSKLPVSDNSTDIAAEDGKYREAEGTPLDGEKLAETSKDNPPSSGGVVPESSTNQEVAIVEAPLRHALWQVPPWLAVLLATLACLLIIGSLSYITHPNSLHPGPTSLEGTPANLQATEHTQATRQAEQQATAQLVGTMQARIDATATVQVIESLTATANVTDTTARHNLYIQSTGGTPTFQDSLKDETGSGKWDKGGSLTGGCRFAEGRYHVSEAQQDYLQPCIAQATQFSNFVYQIQVTLTSGYNGLAGLLFRVDGSGKAYYFFHISGNGSYGLELYTSDGRAVSLASGYHAAILAGLGKTNQLTVIARGDTSILYINRQHITTIRDGTLQKGKIGVAVVNHNAPIDAAFSKAQVWKL
jgi:hypothetical protein